MSRLNGWQRIGIVVSVLWAIGGGLWGNSYGFSRGDWVFAQEARCLKQPNSSPEFDPDAFLQGRDQSSNSNPKFDPDAYLQGKAAKREVCESTRKANWNAIAEERYYFAAGFGLIPIPIAWLSVYGLIGLWRWIRRGFNL
jgi:hypothetical protein